MTQEQPNPLVDWYDTRIGTSSTEDEAYGYWVFLLGVVAGFIGIVLVMMSDVESFERGAGAAIAGIALLLLLIGPVIRLPLKRGATLLSYLGGVMCLLAIAWFVVAYPDNFGAAFDGSEVEIIGLYGLGVLIIALGGAITPLVTSPREEQEAAESRAAAAESQRDAAIAEAEQRGREAAEKEAERAALEVDLQRIEDSQSQFELYEDKAGKYRWRLRHRNRNVIADSAQGYSSRQKAQQGLSAVKRDAFGASVVDLEKTAVDIETTDEAVEGADAPDFVPEVESQATIETYEDAGGKHRWRLRHDNGEIIADSGEGYASRSGRDGAVERVRQYVQPADYLRIDPAAFELYEDAAGEYRWRLLHENGNIIADSGQGYASRQKAKQGLESVKRNVDEGGNADFEVYEDNAGEYRWRLVHRNGNIIADGGEGYASERGANDAVKRVTEYAPEAHSLDIGSAAFEIYEDAEGKWRWRLRHRNGNVLADSGQGYAERTGAEDGLNSVKQNAPNADTEAVEE
ncbi:HVO_2922 family protein [Halovenus marina]|uniref:HVO_2922 family protein n=1 Tax=Halovenus marina TaxID=3396621 RepID=UPI003F559AC3